MRRPRARGVLVGTAVALGIHVVVAAALVRVDTSALLRGDSTVEMEVEEPPPPPPDIKPEPEPPPPPPEVKPKIVMRHMPTLAPPPANPPPNEAPPKEADTPPVFGVSLDSTVGEGPGMAVPVGNTLMTKPHKEAPVQATAASGDPDRLPAPVPEIYISEPAKVTKEVQAVYPPELQRMGIEGLVVAKLYVDENGDVRRVTIVEKAGHGLDEHARDALKKFKFSPARTSDGKAVPTNIIYKYRFLEQQ